MPLLAVPMRLFRRRRSIPSEAAGWADTAAHDPGITLLELLAYAADLLSSYQDRVAAEQQLRSRRALIALAAALAAGGWLLFRRRPDDDA